MEGLLELTKRSAKRVREEEYLSPPKPKKARVSNVITVPVNTVILPHKLRPSTLRDVRNAVKINFPLLDIDRHIIAIDAIWDNDELKEQVLREQSQTLNYDSSQVDITENIEDMIFFEILPHANTDINPFIFDAIDFSRKDMVILNPLTTVNTDNVDKLNEAVVKNIQITYDQDKLRETHVILNTNRPRVIEVVTESFEPKDIVDVEIPLLIGDQSVPSNIEKTVYNINNRENIILDNEDVVAAQQLLEDNSIKVVNAKPHQQESGNLSGLINSLQTSKTRYRLPNKTIRPVYAKIDKDLDYDIIPEQSLMNAPAIREAFNDLGIICSLRTAAKIKRYKLLTYISIFKIGCVAYLMQKHRYNRSGLDRKTLRSHPTVTKRCLLLITILMLKMNSKLVRKALKSIHIGQRSDRYLGSKYTDRGRLGPPLPSNNRHVTIENFFTNYHVRVHRKGK